MAPQPSKQLTSARDGLCTTGDMIAGSLSRGASLGRQLTEVPAVSAVRVRPIDPKRRKDIRAFDRVPFDLYAGSPYWVPPVSGEVGEAMNPRHPYYQHSEAAFFLAERDGRAVGRIGVCHHRPFHELERLDAAYFTYFETIDDPAVASALLGATGEWARQRGLKQQIGPIDFFHGNGFGVLVEGFDQMPVPGIPYNPPYMDSLLKGLGLVQEHDVMSGTLTEKAPPPANLVRMADQLAKEGGIRILRVKNKKELWSWLPRTGRLFEATHIPGQVNVPLTEAEWESLVRHFWPVIDPDLVKLAVRGDEVVGALLAYVHLGEALRRGRGRMLPFGWYHLWRALRAGKRIVINGLRVHPDYQGSGVNLLMYLDMFRTLNSRAHVEEVEIVQVGEKNVRSFGDMSRMGARWTKRHRLYSQKLVETAGGASS